MTSRLLSASLCSLLASTLAACGDDRMEPTATEDPSTSTTAEPTTTDDSTSTTEPTTSGSTTTTTTTTSGDTDMDGDGKLDKEDNCPSAANPNQLDFDKDGIGNVCDDPLRFQMVSGTPPDFNKLDSSASAEMILKCEFPVSLIAVGGDVQVSLDDTGQAKFFAANISYADTPELTCSLGIITVKLKIEQLVTAGDMPFVVGFPFTTADHDAGNLNGMTDMPHSIMINGIINVTESSDPNLVMTGPQPLMDVPGAFPAGQVAVSGSGTDMSITFNDANATVFMQTTMSGITIQLTGLTGTLKMVN